MLKYDNKKFNPKRLDPLSIDRQSIDLIPSRSKVLEIGCATGFTGEYLIKKKECEVIGVEFRKEEAAVAMKKLNKIIIGNIEDRKTIKMIRKNGKFDVVYVSALIEHLSDPWKSLRIWRLFLKENGYLIITTSNIAHWSIRINIIRGNFDYQEYGILDNTHLRFFTTETFKRLVEECGYVIETFSIDAVGGGFPSISKPLSKLFPNLFAYQMVIRAQKK